MSLQRRMKSHPVRFTESVTKKQNTPQEELLSKLYLKLESGKPPAAALGHARTGGSRPLAGRLLGKPGCAHKCSPPSDRHCDHRAATSPLCSWVSRREAGSSSGAMPQDGGARRCFLDEMPFASGPGSRGLERTSSGRDERCQGRREMRV